MAGLGTNDSQLIRILVTRCEIDLADVKIAFQKKYNKTLRSFIQVINCTINRIFNITKHNTFLYFQGDTSGHYKHALYHIIGETASTP